MNLLKTLSPEFSHGVQIETCYNTQSQYTRVQIRQAHLMNEFTMDNTQHTGWTMDPEGSRDLDDALRMETHEDGAVTLHTYIAAPGLHLTTSSPAFKRAFQKRSTRYLASGKTVPMLTPDMEHQHSLLPGESREALYICCTITAEGELLQDKTHVGFVHFCSSARYTYLDAYEQANAPHFELARKFALMRISSRRLRGAPTFVDLDTGEYTDEQGQRIKLVKREEIIGHLIVQEAMIASNEALARWCAERGVLVIYRTHDGPEFENIEEKQSFDDFLKTALENQDEHALALIDSTFSNRLKPATYSAEPGTHWALRAPMYMHGTSPLRRVQDLISQMQLAAYLRQAPLPFDWHGLVQSVDHLNSADEQFEKRIKERFKARTEKLFLEQLLADEELSSKQLRRAIKYILRQAGDGLDIQKEQVLERLRYIIQEYQSHPSGTVPVALLDVILESSWEPARKLARDFLDQHDSGWKQLKAHALAVRGDEESSWWQLYLLEHDPVELQEQELRKARQADRQQQERKREQKAQKKRAALLETSPMAWFNDLKLRHQLDVTFTYQELEKDDPRGQWSGTLLVNKPDTDQSPGSFEAFDQSKKKVRKQLVQDALNWWDESLYDHS